ncbi:MAG: GNAT family N-acetyltransferase [Candidatus Methanoplasma sp.]|nr:GNAT family N-acetyltransferase [Candidatus Methanoplasma sp.]
MTITVSELAEPDIRDAAAVLSQGFKDKMACLKLDQNMAADMLADTWEESPAHRYLVVKEDDRIVGVVHLKIKGPKVKKVPLSVLSKKYGRGNARRYRRGMNALKEKVPNGDCYIAMLAVDEKYRGRGIATELLKAALDLAKTEGFHRLTLYVSKDNPAVGIYKKFGFKIVWETNNVSERIIFGIPHWYFMTILLKHDDRKEFFLHERF